MRIAFNVKTWKLANWQFLSKLNVAFKLFKLKSRMFDKRVNEIGKIFKMKIQESNFWNIKIHGLKPAEISGVNYGSTFVQCVLGWTKQSHAKLYPY